MVAGMITPAQRSSRGITAIAVLVLFGGGTLLALESCGGETRPPGKVGSQPLQPIGTPQPEPQPQPDPQPQPQPEPRPDPYPMPPT